MRTGLAEGKELTKPQCRETGLLNVTFSTRNCFQLFCCLVFQEQEHFQFCKVCLRVLVVSLYLGVLLSVAAILNELRQPASTPLSSLLLMSSPSSSSLSSSSPLSPSSSSLSLLPHAFVVKKEISSRLKIQSRLIFPKRKNVETDSDSCFRFGDFFRSNRNFLLGTRNHSVQRPAEDHQAVGRGPDLGEHVFAALQAVLS